jgi:hypothetical protein
MLVLVVVPKVKAVLARAAIVASAEKCILGVMFG